MRKVANIVCLVLWALLLVWGIVCVVTGERIHPVSFLGATAICVMHYIEEVVSDMEG